MRVSLPASKMLRVRVIALLSDQTVSSWIRHVIDLGLAKDKGMREKRKYRTMYRKEKTEPGNAWVDKKTADAVDALCERIGYSKQSWMEEWIDTQVALQTRTNPDLYKNEERLRSMVEAYEVELERG